MKLKDYRKLEKTVTDKQREHEHAVGVVAHLSKDLLKRFGCKSLSDAIKLHKKLQKKEAEAELAYEDAYTRFYKKWKHLIKNPTDESTT